MSKGPSSAYAAARVLAAVLVLIVSCPAPSSAQAIAGGQFHTLFLDANGALYAWGDNGGGQLGDGTTTQRRVPMLLSLGNVVAIAAGGTHSLAVKNDGTVWSWGTNSNGQLGHGDTQARLTPTQISGFAGVSFVMAGTSHSVALKADGTVWTWGANSSGQLGDGSTTQRTSPTQVTGITTAIGIATRGTHTLVVLANGTALAWGANTNGQLGDGTTTSRTSPVSVSSLTNVVAVAAGDSFSLAQLSDGTAKAWGWNGSGQLGDGTTTQRNSPVTVAGLTNVTGLSAGSHTSYAFLDDKTVKSWGNNGNGQIGDGTTTNRTSPVAVSSLASVILLEAGASHAVVVSDTASVWAWGYNPSAQVGDGTTTRRLSPVRVAEDDYNWKVGTPAFSFPAGTYNTPLNVVVTCATPGASIYYTVDGSEPTLSSSTVVSGGVVTVTETLTLRAKGFKGGMPASNEDPSVYTMKVGVPFGSPNGGLFSTPQSVSATSATGSATIRYTTNGSEPTEASPVISSLQPATVDVPLTLRLKAWRAGWSASDTASLFFTFKVATPVLSPDGGSYSSSQSVTVTTTSPGAVLRYTTDGREPSESDAVVTSGSTLDVSASQTLKVKGWRTAWTTSDLRLASYVLHPRNSLGAADRTRWRHVRGRTDGRHNELHTGCGDSVHRRWFGPGPDFACLRRSVEGACAAGSKGKSIQEGLERKRDHDRSLPVRQRDLDDPIGHGAWWRLRDHSERDGHGP